MGKVDIVIWKNRSTTRCTSGDISCCIMLQYCLWRTRTPGPQSRRVGDGMDTRRCSNSGTAPGDVLQPTVLQRRICHDEVETRVQSLNSSLAVTCVAIRLRCPTEGDRSSEIAMCFVTGRRFRQLVRQGGLGCFWVILIAVDGSTRPPPKKNAGPERMRWPLLWMRRWWRGRARGEERRWRQRRSMWRKRKEPEKASSIGSRRGCP